MVSWVDQNSGPIFPICGPKYTRLGLGASETLQFAAPFSDNKQHPNSTYKNVSTFFAAPFLFFVVVFLFVFLNFSDRTSESLSDPPSSDDT